MRILKPRSIHVMGTVEKSVCFSSISLISSYTSVCKFNFLLSDFHTSKLDFREL